MCEFTVYLNGREDSDVVATNVIKSKIREGNVSLMDSSGKTYKIENADIMTVDSIMAEMHLRSRA
ncbi:MAG: CooT family nickel-binding protein [Candidatus Methanomethylophilaceae archaeon]|jgi:predicted RNA-binding protein|nr:CooT family nickel-binding protein [Candidatus Methanomethylophilaceae archaeon]MBR4216621.1 CooT family nickel-binding protein [Candidatus Methanomethylophilaceae archaeon]MBR4698245.1 CooT family nickel-binding protein [Candidatus Methanomethylophilaceae archaeon]MBR6871343.1 CooT family nickel-binding protein [Candidatus Methanomethylophilaceae archaeon]